MSKKKRQRVQQPVPPLPPRDFTYLGIHATNSTNKFQLDIYGTLEQVSRHPKLPTHFLQASNNTEKVTLALVHALVRTEERVQAVQAAGINPPLWSLGHVAYFYESNVLDIVNAPCNNLKRQTFFDGKDRKELFDSILIDRKERCASSLWSTWTTTDIVRYYRAVKQDLAIYIATCGSDAAYCVDAYLLTYAIIHEYWHIEDLWCMLKKLRLPPVTGCHALSSIILTAEDDCMITTGQALDTVTKSKLVKWCKIHGGTYSLGAKQGVDPFVFDHEKWGHNVQVPTFEIAIFPVTNGEYLKFVRESNGYNERDHWSLEGWRWKTKNNVTSPEYWVPPTDQNASSSSSSSSNSSSSSSSSSNNTEWTVQSFDVNTIMHLDHPVAHVSFWEAEAYCKWRGDCRLPTEAEWEMAAIGIQKERRYPWGKAFDAATRANIGQQRHHTVSVQEYFAGDSIDSGCRQMIGNVWEWTMTTFYPYREIIHIYVGVHGVIIK